MKRDQKITKKEEKGKEKEKMEMIQSTVRLTRKENEEHKHMRV